MDPIVNFDPPRSSLALLTMDLTHRRSITSERFCTGAIIVPKSICGSTLP